MPSSSSSRLKLVPPTGTILGHLPPPNATVLGVAPQKAIDVEIEKLRFAEGTSPTNPAQAPAPTHGAAKWGGFEAIGLVAKPAPSGKAAKWIVSSYRLLGFAILSIIVVVLIGYIVTTTFFFLSHSWVTPVAVSASDEKVVALQSQLATEQGRRDSIADELAQADRAIAAEQSFELEFAKAIKHDLEGRQAALGRVRELANAAASARSQIRSTNTSYATASQARMKQEYAAGLIDRNAMLTGKFQVAQIANSNLSLAERQAELDQRAAELATQTAGLDALLEDHASNASLSYDVLQIKRQYDTSKLELAKDMAVRQSLTASLARQDKIVDALSHSAYLRAVVDHATVSFVPYGNLASVTPGAGLYGCKLGMVVCHKVGKVLEVLPGEVTFKHPRRDKQVRGQMIEIALEAGDAGAAEDDVLFVGGAPLWL